MQLEWDENKNIINKKKHKVSLETAAKVFDDPLCIQKLDCIIDGEERWHAIGQIYGITILLVVHTYRERDNNDVIRIISARKATQHERREYENG